MLKSNYFFSLGDSKLGYSPYKENLSKSKRKKSIKRKKERLMKRKQWILDNPEKHEELRQERVNKYLNKLSRA